MNDKVDETDERPEADEHFKMRLGPDNEEMDERAIPSEINELRLEKISQRVTLISVIIPVLIVIVLVIAYLDIKKRVVQTEDSGAIEFRKLSSDLESRFSTLSVRQAKLEQDLETLIEQNNHAMASVQVRFEKLHDAIGEVRRGALTQKSLNETRDALAQQIDSVAAAADQAGKQNAAFLQEMHGEVVQQGETLTSANARIAELQKRLTDVDARKMDKQAFDLALRLETLRIETAVKGQIDALQSKVNALERQLAQRPSATPAAPRPVPAPTPAPKEEELETQIIK
ncbi:MAG: hypothetical protein KFF50_13545 [Desulfatitalea sp.]|nr:hypothetical protein [Desulfatitalea sp.]